MEPTISTRIIVTLDCPSCAGWWRGQAATFESALAVARMRYDAHTCPPPPQGRVDFAISA